MDNQAPQQAPEAPQQAPQFQPQPLPQPSQGAALYQRPPRKSKKPFIIGGIIAAALIILGGGGALAYNLWYQNPEKVIYDSIMSAVKAKTISGDGQVVVKSESVDVALAFDAKSAATSGLMNVKATIKPKDGKTDAFNVNGSGMVIGDTLYFKLDNLGELVKEIEKTAGEAPSYIATIVDKVNGKWISVKPSDYQDVSKELSVQQECTTKTFEKFSNDSDMKNEVLDAYKQNKVLVVEEKLGSKSINGTGSLGYTVTVDKAATEAFVRSLADTKFGKALKGCDATIDFAKTADAIAEEDDTEGATGTVELWVSRFGHEITQFGLKAKDGSDEVSATLNPVFNQDVTIEAPKDATSLKDLISAIQEAIMEEFAKQYAGMYQDFDYSSFSEYNVN